MKRSVDIDVLLGEDILELKLGGKTYEIKDVSLSVFLMANKSDSEKGDILHKQLATILGVHKKEIEDLGLRAVAFALKEVRNWITETGFEEEPVSANP